MHAVLDLFAGTGVGVAIKQLGAKEYGVEIMPAAIATREANGMETVYNDVWDVHLADRLEFDTLWASPPCQSFSLAGKGAGRKALDDVLGIIERKQYLDIEELRAQSDLLGDDRTGLVLSPLHYAARFKPTYIALEQVPPVLPVWQAMKPELEGMGYSVWVGYLHSEQYGVPQTRKRAYLIARRDGVEVHAPSPSRSLYYPRIPEKLDGARWTSIEEALGWSGWIHESAHSQKNGPSDRPTSVPAKTVTSDVTGLARIAEGRVAQRSLDLYSKVLPTHLSHGTRVNSPVRSMDEPAATMAFGNDIGSFRWVNREDHASNYDAVKASDARLTLDEAKVLQSYPWDFEFLGTKQERSRQIGNAVPPLVAKAVLQELWGE